MSLFLSSKARTKFCACSKEALGLRLDKPNTKKVNDVSSLKILVFIGEKLGVKAGSRVNFHMLWLFTARPLNLGLCLFLEKNGLIPSLISWLCNFDRLPFAFKSLKNVIERFQSIGDGYYVKLFDPSQPTSLRWKKKVRLLNILTTVLQQLKQRGSVDQAPAVKPVTKSRVSIARPSHKNRMLLRPAKCFGR